MSITKPFMWVGEWGFNFEIASGLDATDFSSAVIRITSPAGETAEKTAVTDSEAGGVFYFEVADGDIPTAGQWQAMLEISFGDDGVRKTGPIVFQVGSVVNEGNTDGIGYDAGYTVGHAAGLIAGQAMTYDDGYNAGYTDGQSDC